MEDASERDVIPQGEKSSPGVMLRLEDIIKASDFDTVADVHAKSERCVARRRL